MRHLFRWAVPDLTKCITVIIPDMYIKRETGSLIAQPNLFAFEYAGHQGERWPTNTGISRRCKCQPTNVAIRQAQMSTLFPHLVQVVLSPGWSDRQGGRSDTNLWVCLKRLPNRKFSEFWSRGSGGGRNFRPPVSTPLNSDVVNFDRQAEHRQLFSPLIAWDQEALTKQLAHMSFEDYDKMWRKCGREKMLMFWFVMCIIDLFVFFF